MTYARYTNEASGEQGATCREIGSRPSLEKKIRDEESWKIYKWAYKNITPG